MMTARPVVGFETNPSSRSKTPTQRGGKGSNPLKLNPAGVAICAESLMTAAQLVVSSDCHTTPGMGGLIGVFFNGTQLNANEL